MIDIVIHGVTGRMGAAVAAACRESDDWRVVAGVAPGATGRVPGWDAAPQVTSLNQVDAPFDLAIDFSSPDGTAAAAEACRRLKRPLVSGTTGLADEHRAVLERAAGEIAIVFAPNMSAGVTLLLDLVGRVARALGEDTDAEILEAHHRHKKDAPSGTALRLGEAVAEGWGVPFGERAVYNRADGARGRARGEIGLASLRAADIVGEHHVLFGLAGERLELVHRATDRAIFARGALRAGRWVTSRQPGLYDMRDVLGL